MYASAWGFTPHVGRPQTFRTLHTITVRFPLVSWSGAGATALKKFKIGLRFKFNGALRSEPVRDPIFTGLNSHLVANRWDLDRFSTPFRPAITPAPPGHIASAGSGYGMEATTWIDRNAEYVKLTVTHDGLYRVTASDIAASAFNLTPNFTARNIRCINHGREVPIWIDSDASGNIIAIEFYGEHLRGFALPTVFPPGEKPKAEWFNLQTDKNAYWLTTSNKTGGLLPLRYAPRSPAKSGTQITTSRVMLHHERDYFYYKGDAGDEEKTIQQTEYENGERFEWAEMHPPNIDLNHRGDTSRVTDTFFVTSLPPDAQSRSAHFKFLVRGMSTNLSSGRDLLHQVLARVNGETLGAEIFKNFDYDSLERDVPLSKLHVGANIVEVLSAGTIDDLDFFYFDHYEVSYDDALTPSLDTAVAKGQWLFSVSPNAGVYQLSLAGSGSSASLFNLTDQTDLTDQAGVFVDSSSASLVTYAAATPSSFLKCDAIAAWGAGHAGADWHILDGTKQLDYIVITHPDFSTQAGELVSRRSAVLKSTVITTEEIYNAFNYGSDEPEALRRFLSYAYYHYAAPPVSMVTLLGDASWDPKMNMNNVMHYVGDRSTQPSFVPTYGWPSSDSYFTLIDSNIDLSGINSGMLIARIPIASASEADAYISKMVEYEEAPPAEWNQRWLFIAGGYGQGQHDEFMNEARTYLSSPQDRRGGLGMSDPPADIDSTIIEGVDHINTDPSQIGAIVNAVRHGQSLMYFAGHGATWITDVVLPDPNEIHNKGLYPLLITLSCRTGAFSEYNAMTLNESYLRAPQSGSAQAYGTTGFGDIYYDYTLSAKFFQLMRQSSYDSSADSLRPHLMNMTALLTAAKFYTSDTGYHLIGPTSANARLQYSMLGDAAIGFALRPQPEFAVHASDLAATVNGGLPRTFFSVNDSTITLSALVHNYGYAAGRPVVVRLLDVGPNNLNVTYFDTLPKLLDSARVNFTIGLTPLSIGQHTLYVTIDPAHNFPESDTLDNTASLQIQVNGLSATPFYPYEGSRQFCDENQSSVHFIVLVPQGVNPSDQVELDLDTTERFANPIRSKHTNAGSSYYVTFDIPLPATPIPNSGVYWWRTRIHKTTGETSPWEYATFSTAAAPRSEFSYSSPEQLASTVVSGLIVDQKGMLVIPMQDTVRFEVISHGQHDSAINGVAVGQIFINDRSVFEAQYSIQGYEIARLTIDGSGIDTVYKFDVDYLKGTDTSYTHPIADAFAATIANFPAGTRVIVLTNQQPAYPGITDNPKVLAAMQSIGSKSGFAVPYFGSYALIGTKGLAPGAAKELINGDGSSGVRLFDTTITFGTSGSAETPFTAVASAQAPKRGYGNFRWSGVPPVSGSNIKFTILGSRRDGTGVDEIDTLLASAGKQLDLSKIDPRRYDHLAIRAAFSRSSNAAVSPAISSLELEYDAAPELAFTDSLLLSPNVVTEGEAVIARYGVTTLTCASADSVLVPIVRQLNGRTDTPAYHVIKHLDGRAAATFVDTLKPIGGGQGVASVTATVNPGEAQNEQLLFNNTVNGVYTIGRDTSKPYAEILLDGRHIPMNGFASGTASITIDLFSPNPLRDTVPNSIIAEIRPEDHYGNVITVSVNSTNNYHVQFTTQKSGNLQASLLLQLPSGAQYAPGRWDVTAFVHDASGNTDTVEQTFTVSATNGIQHVMNYPNPFKDKTSFTFELRSDAPADVKIVVYTIAGRKIRTLTPTILHAGLNWIDWDGRDTEGNPVGNGTYLYRAIINGKNPDGSDVADGVTQTAVRSR
jgi:hypothetical protein